MLTARLCDTPFRWPKVISDTWVADSFVWYYSPACHSNTNTDTRQHFHRSFPVWTTASLGSEAKASSSNRRYLNRWCHEANYRLDRGLNGINLSHERAFRFKPLYVFPPPPVLHNHLCGSSRGLESPCCGLKRQSKTWATHSLSLSPGDLGTSSGWQICPNTQAPHTNMLRPTRLHAAESLEISHTVAWWLWEISWWAIWFRKECLRQGSNCQWNSKTLCCLQWLQNQGRLSMTELRIY